MSPYSNTGKLGPRAAPVLIWPAGSDFHSTHCTLVRPAGQRKRSELTSFR